MTRRSDPPRLHRAALAGVLMLCGIAPLSARPWSFTGIPEPLEAEFVAMKNGFVLLKGPEGKGVEVGIDKFIPADRRFLELLSSGEAGKPPLDTPGTPVTRRRDYAVKSVEEVTREFVEPAAASELHVTGAGDPIAGSSFNFTATDGWLFLDQVKPSAAGSRFLDRFLVNGRPADPAVNIRLARHGPGCVVIPHGPDFPALTVFASPDLAGARKSLRCHVHYGEDELGGPQAPVRSFILRRGYMATLAANADGTGASRNYVAQDHDIVFNDMPDGLDKGVRFVRVFPWQWTAKKGIAGGIHQDLDVGWFYDWNIEARSSPDLEYVAIKQKRYWPGMDQDWKSKGINHLLGYNEPDRPDQAKMTVDEAIRGWPELQRTGLRLGSPATSDGGLGWLYEFMDQADRAGLRVDFVAVHYYRGHGNPGDAKGAARQLLAFLQSIHDRTRRPLWVTEWNNGANWTTTPDPNERQQREAIKAMIEMMDETPFVERYALFNWVEPVRELVRKDGSLTPAGAVYRDQASPPGFLQPKNPR